MILSGLEIKKEIENGVIDIIPFDEMKINPNSYNLRLSDELLVYKSEVLDMKKDLAVEKITIPNTGYLLLPGRLYLGKTYEFTHTNRYVPMLEGRSSLGRLGLYVHVSAGFGDVGYAGNWTLELSCVQPVVIYPFIDICQIYFNEIKGEYTLYNGKYHGYNDISKSLMYKELK